MCTIGLTAECFLQKRIAVMPNPEMLAMIQGVKARYCRLLDTKDWDGFADLFTDDVVLDVQQDTGQPPFHGRDALVEQIKAAVINARTSHQVHTPEITLVNERTASAIWAMQDRVMWDAGKSPIPPATGITGYGQYHESYRLCDDGAWRIASLKLTRFIVEMDQ
jgi:hypothetical protein